MEVRAASLGHRDVKIAHGCGRGLRDLVSRQVKKKGEGTITPGRGRKKSRIIAYILFIMFTHTPRIDQNSSGQTFPLVLGRGGAGVVRKCGWSEDDVGGGGLTEGSRVWFAVPNFLQVLQQYYEHRPLFL